MTRPMRILITGSRNHTDRKLIRDAIYRTYCDAGMPDKVTVVHGACPSGGADKIAHDIALEYGFNVEPHPANWKRYGPSAGPKRNGKMVLLGADICLAFPLGESRGTWDCVSQARARQIPVLIFEAEEAK